MDTRVYVMTHKQFTPPDDPLYIPLHVGEVWAKIWDFKEIIPGILFRKKTGIIAS